MGLKDAEGKQLPLLVEAHSNGDSNFSVPLNVIYLLEQMITLPGTLYKPADTVNIFFSILKTRKHEKEFARNWMDGSEPSKSYLRVIHTISVLQVSHQGY